MSIQKANPVRLERYLKAYAEIAMATAKGIEAILPLIDKSGMKGIRKMKPEDEELWLFIHEPNCNRLTVRMERLREELKGKYGEEGKDAYEHREPIYLNEGNPSERLAENLEDLKDKAAKWLKLSSPEELASLVERHDKAVEIIEELKARQMPWPIHKALPAID